METSKTSGLLYNCSNKNNHELTHFHLTVKNQNCCHECKQKIYLSNKITPSQSDEHKNNRKLWYCDICEKGMNINTESKHIISNTHIHSKEDGIVVKKIG